jgi:hypothetical protein
MSYQLTEKLKNLVDFWLVGCLVGWWVGALSSILEMEAKGFSQTDNT